jgi:hypothetical protein
MGAMDWTYVVPFQADVSAALQTLRRAVFASGEFHVGGRPGRASPRSIDEAVEMAGADGTRSILDIDGLANAKAPGKLATLSADELLDLYGTLQPTREMVGGGDELFEELDRGEAVYVVMYADGRPHELFIAGYSFD